MSSCIKILTFSRVSKHESILHLSKSWLKYSSRNVYARLSSVTDKQRLLLLSSLHSESSNASLFFFLFFLLMDPLNLCAILTLNASRARYRICRGEGAGNRPSSCHPETVVGRSLQTFADLFWHCSAISSLQSFQIVPVWIVSGSAVAPIAYIETEWKAGWKRNVIADEGQTLRHYCEVFSRK